MVCFIPNVWLIVILPLSFFDAIYFWSSTVEELSLSDIHQKIRHHEPSLADKVPTLLNEEAYFLDLYYFYGFGWFFYFFQGDALVNGTIHDSSSESQDDHSNDEKEADDEWEQVGRNNKSASLRKVKIYVLLFHQCGL